MDYTSTKKTIFGAILISICIFSIIFAVSAFRYFKTVESKFNNEKADLIKENMDLQDKVDSLEEDIAQKTGIATNLETEKKTLEARLITLGEEAKNLESRYGQLYGEKIKILKKENLFLRSRSDDIKKMSLVNFLKATLAKEGNSNIKEVVKDALSKVELINSGKSVRLEPIVVAEKDKKYDKENDGSFDIKNLSGKIVSIDTVNNLVVVDIGRQDGVKDGQKCVISKGSDEIASGEIISTRYKLSAVFVGEIRQKHTFSDIAEGDIVSING